MVGSGVRLRRSAVALIATGIFAVLGAASSARAEGSAVIEFRYTPVVRAQVAIWIEDPSGTFLATVALSESVAYRGIGNRPGASLMNSGYRWPYGRREGVLPIWAHRRASAPGAKLFGRVIFQNRVEGFASQTTSDQSRDNYYCLQFDSSKSSRDELDAVSCATMFNSDKGRYATQADIDKGYSEPWETRDTAGTGTGMRVAMPLKSLYPPRMDTSKCVAQGTCFDSDDVSRYADDVRAVMPDIDAVTKATAPGDMPQKLLFSVPASWAKGDYVAWIEVNVEGDYNEDQAAAPMRAMGWNDSTFPTPMYPEDAWDFYAKNYGYPYRGQPSIVYKVPFKLGDDGERSAFVDMPAGRSSWDHWADDYGKLEPITFSAGDARHMSEQNGSGADRLRRDSQGHRVVVVSRGTVKAAPEPPVVVPSGDDAGVKDPPPPPDEATEPPTCGSMSGASGGSGTSGSTGGSGAVLPQGASGQSASAPPGDAIEIEGPDGVVIENSGDCRGGPIGPILDLRLRPHPDKLRAHTWIMLRFRAATSLEPVHEYEVRVATEPITDDASFVRLGRPARNATDDSEGATALMLPTKVARGKFIEAAIGDLVADTRYYVAVRATDELNRHGPISVAEISTPPRTFATVTPCFVATAAYGSPLASEIDVLRRFRDRQLSATSLGRAFVEAYGTYGPSAAHFIAAHETLRGWVRGMLSALVALARLLP